MAVTIVNTQVANVGAAVAGTTGITVTKPTGLADGDVMYAFVGRTDFANSAAWTSSGWTALGPAAASQGSTTGNDTQTTILRKVVTNAAGETSTYTFVNTQATVYQTAAIIIALRGVDPNTPEDITVPAYGFTQNSINPATLNATSVTDNAFVIAYLQMSMAAATYTANGAPSTYTLLTASMVAATVGSLDNHMGCSTKTLGAGGSTTGTSAWTNTGDPGTIESLTAVVLVRALRAANTLTTAAASADVVTMHAYEFASPRQTVMSRRAIARMIR